MNSNSISMNIGVTTPTEDTDPLVQYPNISESEAARLEWHVLGTLQVHLDGELLTDSPFSVEGQIHDYVWQLLMEFHSALRRLLQGENVEVTLLDNPGKLTIVSQADAAIISFDPESSGISHSGTVSISAFAHTLLEATESVEKQLLSLNSNLENSVLITELRSESSATKAALDARGYTK
ncbi:hypothetical protein [Halogranum rubrum]|uniref:hypothetical protein n=1 Tax=Halogranum rubrum TaxID=553466 RepID=UPI000677C82F|nr:hypothetical protein [Halogranum salarium]